MTKLSNSNNYFRDVFSDIILKKYKNACADHILKSFNKLSFYCDVNKIYKVCLFCTHKLDRGRIIPVHAKVNKRGNSAYLNIFLTLSFIHIHEI